MQASNTRPARKPVLPMAALPAIRRCAQWPFPVGVVRRTSGDIAATAQGVIATTARAFLTQKASC
ncbi:hypothetical protein [Candidatus Aalborgicola defluviihabitans]|uniref:hypothetical protein n=1 Tax=Candidatus Aalborgicola defluviihabitans TaxID=3386187 RepID=UPI001EC6E641|nr:hypothetical protein [Rhodoferax sp.]MBK6567974.1 hypothetical protein [Burkholderiales bacterium]MBK7281429.1 hypothetical protein [Burkholderiales bacterium]